MENIVFSFDFIIVDNVVFENFSGEIEIEFFGVNFELIKGILIIEMMFFF